MRYRYHKKIIRMLQENYDLVMFEKKGRAIKALPFFSVVILLIYFLYFLNPIMPIKPATRKNMSAIVATRPIFRTIQLTPTMRFTQSFALR